MFCSGHYVVRHRRTSTCAISASLKDNCALNKDVWAAATEREASDLVLHAPLHSSHRVREADGRQTPIHSSWYTGVDSYDVNLAEKKVTINGNVTPQVCIDKISKMGKETTLWAP
jgi:hypothetical protein